MSIHKAYKNGIIHMFCLLSILSNANIISSHKHSVNVLESWNKYTGYNCYGQNGATVINPNPWPAGEGSLEKCKSECSNHLECSGIVFITGSFCYLRKNLQLSSCTQGSSTFNVYIPPGKLFSNIMMIYAVL